MSKQHFLKKLLNGAEVEWKPLGEILNRTKGTKITASQMFPDHLCISIFSLHRFHTFLSRAITQEW